MYGSSGVWIDWSQFEPRGHYTRSPELRRYFRTLMWLGRVDLGFVLAQSDATFGGYDVSCERRDALLLTRLLEETGAADRLEAIDRSGRRLPRGSRRRRHGARAG